MALGLTAETVRDPRAMRHIFHFCGISRSQHRVASAFLSSSQTQLMNIAKGRQYERRWKQKEKKKMRGLFILLNLTVFIVSR